MATNHMGKKPHSGPHGQKTGGLLPKRGTPRVGSGRRRGSRR
jgi:hypothetical protein